MVLGRSCLPSEEEGKVLETFFHFHPLAIEDCLHLLQRPKLDYYEGYSFLVLHYLNSNTLDVEEVDCIYWGKLSSDLSTLKPVPEY